MWNVRTQNEDSRHAFSINVIVLSAIQLTTKLNIQEYNKFVATLLVLLLYGGEDMDGS